LTVKYGQPLSEIFNNASDLKRSYEFFSNPKTTFDKLTQPSFKQTASYIYGIPVVLALGDTTYLDYKKILEKREEYGPTGNGGNGLILHSSLAVDPDFGQPLVLTVIAAQLLRMTYLHRNSPHSSAAIVLTKLQMDVLLTSTPAKQKKNVELTVDWAIRAIARLGGYLEHRKNSPIGIQVLWRGWLRLETLCQGWLLHQNLKSLY
jgi:hypothetical protein